MLKETTYTHARANFASLCEQVSATREAVMIHRRGKESVALVSSRELASLEETAHLLRSPRNAERLLKALNRSRKTKLEPETLAGLRKEMGIDASS